MAAVQSQVKDGLSFGPFNLVVGGRLLTKRARLSNSAHVRSTF